MKLAHIVAITPNRAGLYETVRELCAAERELGVDARMVNPSSAHKQLDIEPGGSDRGALVADMAWACDADVVFNHSGYDGTPLEQADNPVIYCSHGRPAYSFAGERSGRTPVYSYWRREASNPRLCGVVTYWREHAPYLSVMFPAKPIYIVTPSVDLKAWAPGPRQYDFHGKGGRVNVVIADPWRDDVDPFTAVNAFALFRRSVPGAKLHVYGCEQNRRGFDAIFKTLDDSGNLGEVCGWVNGLVNVYRAADLVISPNRIYTRTIREAMATGAQVVSGRNVDCYDIKSFALAMMDRLSEPLNTRLIAERAFNPKRSAGGMIEVADRVVADTEVCSKALNAGGRE